MRCPSYADSAGNFVAGNGNGVVDLNGIQVAVATCYEVAFDDLVTESVKAGATVIAVPTNNATFGRNRDDLSAAGHVAGAGGRTRPQCADRSNQRCQRNHHASGCGALQQSEIFTAQALTDEIAVRSDLTLATRVGSIPELALVCDRAFSRRFGTLQRHVPGSAG